MNFRPPVLIPALFLTGCASSGTPTPDEIRANSMLVDPGMTKSQVVAIMGQPEQRSFRGNGEALTFCGIAPFKGSLYYTVWLNDGSTTAITNYQLRDDVGNCAQYIKPVDWGQAPADVKVKLDIN